MPPALPQGRRRVQSGLGLRHRACQCSQYPVHRRRPGNGGIDNAHCLMLPPAAPPPACRCPARAACALACITPPPPPQTPPSKPLPAPPDHVCIPRRGRQQRRRGQLRQCQRHRCRRHRVLGRTAPPTPTTAPPPWTFLASGPRCRARLARGPRPSSWAATPPTAAPPVSGVVGCVLPAPPQCVSAVWVEAREPWVLGGGTHPRCPTPPCRPSAHAACVVRGRVVRVLVHEHEWRRCPHCGPGQGCDPRLGSAAGRPGMRVGRPPGMSPKCCSCISAWRPLLDETKKKHRTFAP